MLPQPAGFQSWDPLLQRVVVPCAAELRPFLCPVTPATTASNPDACSYHSATHPPSAHTPAIATPSATPIAAPAANAPTTPAPGDAPPTPAELEASSLALAWRLQQEEQDAFVRAMSASTPSAGQRGGAAGETAGGTPEGGGEQMDTDDDESLQLAIRLQQEELEWQQLHSRQQLLAAMSGAGEEGLEQLEEEQLAALQRQAQGTDGADH